MKLKYYIFFIVIAVCFSECKKYPENTLWFKDPEKTYPLQGYITKYQVNGIDSLDLLNNYFGKYPKNGGMIRDIRKAEFRKTSLSNSDKYLYTLLIFGTSGCTLEMYPVFKHKKNTFQLKQLLILQYTRKIFLWMQNGKLCV